MMSLTEIADSLDEVIEDGVTDYEGCPVIMLTPNFMASLSERLRDEESVNGVLH